MKITETNFKELTNYPIKFKHPDPSSNHGTLIILGVLYSQDLYYGKTIVFFEWEDTSTVFDTLDNIIKYHGNWIYEQ